MNYMFSELRQSGEGVDVMPDLPGDGGGGGDGSSGHSSDDDQPIGMIPHDEGHIVYRYFSFLTFIFNP